MTIMAVTAYHWTPQWLSPHHEYCWTYSTARYMFHFLIQAITCQSDNKNEGPAQLKQPDATCKMGVSQLESVVQSQQPPPPYLKIENTQSQSAYASNQLPDCMQGHGSHFGLKVNSPVANLIDSVSQGGIVLQCCT